MMILLLSPLTMKQDVICLIAPTASGKTALAYELYDTGRYHLISVDSALIYRNMNIGTAKPTVEELAKYPHALVDIIDPTESYSVAQFVKDVEREIDFAHRIGKTPLLVGGTMMYYMALLEGMNDIPATEPQVREQVMAMIANDGIERVHQYLHQIDPITAERLKSNDTQRIGRAVEVFIQTENPLSKWHEKPLVALADNPVQNWQVFAIMPDRAWLHQRIDLRLQMMWEQGFVAEVIGLMQLYPLHAEMPSMRCVGYRQVWNFLTEVWQKNDENLTFNDFMQQPMTQLQRNLNAPQWQTARQTMQNEALYATRQLAKRQYTWLRRLITQPKIKIQILSSVGDVKKLLK
ncbi:MULTISPECIES: tRNA (adenosine(37)-N6)-dimethylallyltransferase MiaA [unclassified Moraxella]|uniref:tRNA (adenosine(37)-N6)-dimethylallyltransferase MiaA n=1 Tax=unclassified Moraxella TaxID=2685852 RepID=UPI003AF4310E